MVELYKFLQEEHGLKDMHIKHYNMLLSTKGFLKVYHLDTSTKTG